MTDSKDPRVEPVETPLVETPLVEPVETPRTGFRQALSLEAPLLAVTHGNPTPEELAAVTAVVLSLAANAAPAPAPTPAQSWVRRARLHLPPRPGAGAWRRSGF